jgi:hypothetical protein
MTVNAEMPDNEVPAAQPRQLKLSLSAVAGNIDRLFAWIDGKLVINVAKRTGEWEGVVSPSDTRIQIMVVGIGAAQYKVDLDLPGTANDQSIQYSLKGGFHEAEFVL